MKELLRKKSVKISILLIVLIVVMGIVGINAWSAQKSREYDGHIAAAEKYLSELDYEQAIAEYTMAFEIDPREEVVDALEQTYLAYAQTYIDSGDYERAIGILEEGYEKIGRESLQNKIAEVNALQAQKQLEEQRRASGMVEFPFQMADVTVMGYHLSEDHFEQMQGLFPVEGEGHWDVQNESVYHEGSGITSDEWGYEITTEYMNEGESKFLHVSGVDRGNWTYIVDYRTGGSFARLSISNYYGNVFEYAGINVPVAAGESYQDWCRVMQIDQIKENDLRPEERDGMVGIWREDGYAVYGMGTGEGWEHWLFSAEGYQGMYSELDRGNGDRYCELQFCLTEPWIAGEQSLETIKADIGSDGLITNIEYWGRPIVE